MVDGGGNGQQCQSNGGDGVGGDYKYGASCCGVSVMEVELVGCSNSSGVVVVMVIVVAVEVAVRGFCF